jgi:site-specific DNA-methyltransferase (adenine-specific)
MKHFAFNADCMEIMSRYPDKWFDLAVVDPPYGINRDKKQNKNEGKWGFKEYHKTEWDNKPPDKKYWDELFRVSQNQIVWGANHFISLIPYDSPCWLIWDKVTGEGFDFADCEMAWTSFKSSVRKYTYARGNDRGFAPNLKGIDRVGINIHPTQKPVSLYQWIFKNYLPEGGRVLDTHGGSMSSLISAIKAGNIEMTISELDADYYASAQKRVNDFMSQLNLFQERPEIIW